MGTLVFSALGTALLALWGYLALRYLGPNGRWFEAYTARETRAGGKRAPAWTFWLVMFRPDPDPTIEAAREEMAKRARPLAVVFGTLCALWALVVLVVLVVLGVHALWP